MRVIDRAKRSAPAADLCLATNVPVASRPMRLTIRHHYDFGADRELVGDDVVTRPSRGTRCGRRRADPSPPPRPATSLRARRRNGPRSASARARSTAGSRRTGSGRWRPTASAGVSSSGGWNGPPPSAGSCSPSTRPRRLEAAAPTLPLRGGSPARPARRPAAARGRAPVPPRGHRAHEQPSGGRRGGASRASACSWWRRRWQRRGGFCRSYFCVCGAETCREPAGSLRGAPSRRSGATRTMRGRWGSTTSTVGP